LITAALITAFLTQSELKMKFQEAAVADDVEQENEGESNPVTSIG
jgi:hypothetical protein